MTAVHRQYARLEGFDQVADAAEAYLQTRQLNAVRRDLRASGPGGDTVRNVASRWGFWHMGQFAADYRKLFGELPSQTLRGLEVGP